MTPVSIRPSDAVEGGAVPVNKNLLWKEARFNLFEYKTKAGEVVATTTALRVTYVDDFGAEYVQQYSAADPERFVPNDKNGGKTIIAVKGDKALSKSSNFIILMTNLVNAGFPENKLAESKSDEESGEISVLDGLYTHNIGIPEPSRAGLKREAPAEGEQKYAKVISVPDQILKLPWEKKGKVNPPAAAGKSAAKAGVPSEDVITKTLDFIGKEVKAAEGNTVTRQEVATAIFAKMAKDPDRDAVAGLLYKPEMQARLLGAGFTVDGENISKAA